MSQCFWQRRSVCTVDTAANGRLALGRVQRRPYALILCDLRVPELDGPGFYQALRQRAILLTGDLSSVGHEFRAKGNSTLVNLLDGNIPY